MLEDIAVLTGGQVISEDTGPEAGKRQAGDAGPGPPHHHH